MFNLDCNSNLHFIEITKTVQWTKKDFEALNSSIIICGHGDQPNHCFEVIGKAKIELPPLMVGYTGIHGPSLYPRPILIMTLRNELFLIKTDICKILKNNSWTFHSKTIKDRINSVIISMPDGMYIFGGTKDPKNTIEFLPNESKVWKLLPTCIPQLPHKPNTGYRFGVAISSTEILIMGGLNYETFGSHSTILKFNIVSKKWCNIGELIEGRSLGAAVVLNNKIIISGGKINIAEGTVITEIIDLPIDESNLPIKPRRGGDLNFARRESWQGMGLIRIKGKQKLIIFSNSTPKLPIEMWNEEKEIWEVSEDLQFPGGNPCHFGYFGYCFNNQVPN